jgi:hypothetical protein
MGKSNKSPEWLEVFQSDFAKSVRTPFDFSNGKFIRKQTELFSKSSYADIAPFKSLMPIDRLALYNEQYWFRFLTLMQDDYPLVSRFMGLWEFNKWVSLYLDEEPSKSVYLQILGKGFAAYLAKQKCLDKILQKQYVEMANLDRLWSDVFMSQGAKKWVPTPGELAKLETQLLNFHPSFRLYEESWNWVDLRKTAISLEGEEKLRSVPKEMKSIWVFFRAESGVVSMRLEPSLARLLELLQSQLLHVSLDEVSAEFPHENLEQKVMSWFQQGLELGWFTGLRK